MAEIGHNLMIRYGLSRAATATEAAAWAKRVQELMAAGYTPAQAGDTAAQAILPGYQTRHYASEGDTVEMLLQRLNNK